jgi:hypothetical protein
MQITLAPQPPLSRPPRRPRWRRRAALLAAIALVPVLVGLACTAGSGCGTHRPPTTLPPPQPPTPPGQPWYRAGS